MLLINEHQYFFTDTVVGTAKLSFVTSSKSGYYLRLYRLNQWNVNMSTPLGSTFKTLPKACHVVDFILLVKVISYQT